MFKSNLWWLLPILAMAAIAPFTPALDISAANYFYNGDEHHFSNNAFYEFMYQYGVIPAEITAIIAFLVLCLSYLRKSFKKWQLPSLVLVLTMVIGAGVIAHALLKDHWGRPRPRQIVNFGGTQPYRSFYKPNFTHEPEHYKSFPCGHCTMGFYFFALALVFKRLDYTRLFYTILVFAFLLGTALGIARMAQGGHFLSDILMGALIMWLTAYVSDWLLYAEKRKYP